MIWRILGKYSACSVSECSLELSASEDILLVFEMVLLSSALLAIEVVELSKLRFVLEMLSKYDYVIQAPFAN